MLSNIFHFGQIFKFKYGRNSEKKNGIKISCGYAHLHIMSFIFTKFHEILLSGFRGVALTRKTGLTDWLTNWQTDWLTDGSKTLYPTQHVNSRFRKEYSGTKNSSCYNKLIYFQFNKSCCEIIEFALNSITQKVNAKKKWMTEICHLTYVIVVISDLSVTIPLIIDVL